MNFTAIILAAGKSSRMGRDKAFLPVNSEPLITHSLRRVRDAGAGEVLISGRPEQDFSGFDLPVLLDAYPDCGPLGGIERGLAVARHPLVLVVAVDLPHMTSDCARWLVSRGASSAGGRLTGCPVGIVPVHNGRWEPLAASYPRQAHSLVKEMLRGRQYAARDFVTRCLKAGWVTAESVPADHQSCFDNWNLPQDVSR